MLIWQDGIKKLLATGGRKKAILIRHGEIDVDIPKPPGTHGIDDYLDVYTCRPGSMHGNNRGSDTHAVGNSVDDSFNKLISEGLSETSTYAGDEYVDKKDNKKLTEIGVGGMITINTAKTTMKDYIKGPNSPLTEAEKPVGDVVTVVNSRIKLNTVPALF